MAKRTDPTRLADPEAGIKSPFDGEGTDSTGGGGSGTGDGGAGDAGTGNANTGDANTGNDSGAGADAAAKAAAEKEAADKAAADKAAADKAAADKTAGAKKVRHDLTRPLAALTIDELQERIVALGGTQDDVDKQSAKVNAIRAEINQRDQSLRKQLGPELTKLNELCQRHMQAQDEIRAANARIQQINRQKALDIAAAESVRLMEETQRKAQEARVAAKGARA